MKIGVSVIVKDGMGEVLRLCPSLPRNHIIEPHIAEAFVTLRAAHLCCELEFNKVILESNALQVVQALKKDGRSWCYYGHLIEEARRMLNCLYSWKVNHDKRNEAAYRLAKETLSLTVEKCISDIIFVERCT